MRLSTRPFTIVMAAMLLRQASAQQELPTTEVYRSDFNSSFKLTPAQIQEAELSDSLATAIEHLVTAQRSQYAFGGVDQDDFYTVTLPSNVSPGQILKVQLVTNTSSYALPPGTALSRIIYTSTNLNGTVVPTSGYILWPFLPRLFNSPPSATRSKSTQVRVPVPIVVWAHGTSGVFAPNAPSANRFLQYWHTATYPLAQAGYVVFAPDYAGLGVRYYSSFNRQKTEIPHQYLVAPAQARDVLFGLRSLFNSAEFNGVFSGDYLIMGHSQGGAIAWATAELLATTTIARPDLIFDDLVAGYKGTISLAPSTSLFAGKDPGLEIPAMAQMLSSIFPSFNLSSWLTPLGIKRLNLARELEGEIALFASLFAASDAMNSTLTGIRPDFYESSWYAQALERLAIVGGRDFLGPMLILQGEADPITPESVNTPVIAATEEFINRGSDKDKRKGNTKENRDLEYVVAKGVGHTPILDVTRPIWMAWIEDRFGGKEIKQKGLVRREIQSFLDWERYARVLNSVPLWAGLPQFSYLVLGSV